MALPNPIVEGNVLQVPAIQSIDYRDGQQQGWQIARDGSATFNNLNSFGNVGASQMSADLGIFGDIQLPNFTSLNTQLGTLDPTSSTYPVAKGLIAYGRDQSGNPTITAYPFGTLAIRAHFEISRAYRVSFRGRVNAMGTDDIYVSLRYTTDNTVPVVGSSILSDMIMVRSGAFGFVNGSVIYEASTSVEQDIWVGAYIVRAAGASATTPTEVTVNPNYWELWIEDIGLGNIRVNTPVSYYASPSAPPPPATKTYTKTYYATWSRTYDGSNATTWDDSAYCYQGYYSTARGNTKSLVGFDYATIAADLSGATINSCKVTVKGAHAYYNSGYTLEWGTHNYTAKPSTWANGNVNQNRGALGSFAAGETATLNLGTTVGGEFKSQATRGISFGPGPTTSLTYYGYAYGATQSGKPYLTITYTK